MDLVRHRHPVYYRLTESGSVPSTVSRTLFSLINNYVNKTKSNIYPCGAFPDISFSNDSCTSQTNYSDTQVLPVCLLSMRLCSYLKLLKNHFQSQKQHVLSIICFYIQMFDSPDFNFMQSFGIKNCLLNLANMFGILLMQIFLKKLMTLLP